MPASRPRRGTSRPTGRTVAAYPRTKLPHAGHVLLSTWASLFHMSLAMETNPTAATGALVGVFLFVAVWVPCCTSDIVFPLLFAQNTPARG